MRYALTNIDLLEIGCEGHGIEAVDSLLLVCKLARWSDT